MDGIAFDWTRGVAGHVAEAWVRPRRMLASLDVFAVLIASIASYLLLALRPTDLHVARFSLLIFQLLIGLATMTLLYRDGQYSPQRRMARFADLSALVKDAFVAFFFACGVWLATDGFFTGFRDESRLLIFSGALILGGLLVINRLAVTWYQRRLFSRGEGMRSVVLVGQGRVAAELAGLLEKRSWLGVRCAGIIPARGDSFSIERIRQTLQSGDACELIVALDPEEKTEFDRVTEALYQAGLSFSVAPSLFEESLRVSRAHGFRELPVINVHVDPLDQVQRTLKRALDVTVSALALLVSLPLLVVVAAAVRIDSSGPVVFRQVRLGQGGRPFEILKFRTMVVGAEAQLDKLKAHDEGDGPHFKMKKDPRITRIGAFLRKWSLDELLQFVNVLRGDMSLVGPRPPLPREVDQYETSQLVRLKGKPGITGLWQVSGRKDLRFDDMVNLDRHYLENWSIGMDLQILARTASVVLARKGAY